MSDISVLVRTEDHSISDDAGKKGDILHAFPSIYPWGPGPTNPPYGLITVLDATLKDYQHLGRMWWPLIVLENVSGDRYKISTDSANSAGKGAVTKPQVQRFLDRWNATFISTAANEVIFDLTVGAAGASKQFLGVGNIPAGIEFSESAGVVTMSHPLGLTPDQKQHFIHRLMATSAELIDMTEAETTYRVEKSDIAAKITADIEKYNSNHFQALFRHRVKDATIDLLIAAGRRKTVTEAVFLANLEDKADG